MLRYTLRNVETHDFPRPEGMPEALHALLVARGIRSAAEAEAFLNPGVRDLADPMRLSGMAVPFEQAPCVSGLRVFGLGDGEKPAEPVFTAARMGDLDMIVQIAEQSDALGYNILFGSSPDKLYHSYMVFEAGSRRVGALIKDREYTVRVDAFNENGITAGKCVKL